MSRKCEKTRSTRDSRFESAASSSTIAPSSVRTSASESVCPCSLSRCWAPKYTSFLPSVRAASRPAGVADSSATLPVTQARLHGGQGLDREDQLASAPNSLRRCWRFPGTGEGRRWVRWSPGFPWVYEEIGRELFERFGASGRRASSRTRLAWAVVKRVIGQYQFAVAFGERHAQRSTEQAPAPLRSCSTLTTR